MHNKHQSDENLPQDEFIRLTKLISFQENIIRKFLSMSENITEISNESNNEITTDEILKAVHSLKNGKSASADLISNEMLEKSSTSFIKTTP